MAYAACASRFSFCACTCLRVTATGTTPFADSNTAFSDDWCFNIYTTALQLAAHVVVHMTVTHLTALLLSASRILPLLAGQGGDY